MSYGFTAIAAGDHPNSKGPSRFVVIRLLWPIELNRWGGIG
jgi:hypothetical protein